MPMASVISEATSAVCFARAPLGPKPVASAPTSGTTQRTVSQGKSLMLFRGPLGIWPRRGAAGKQVDFVGWSCEFHRQQRQDDEEHAAEQGQRVGADEAVL